MTTKPEQLYDEDFFAWTVVQARELRRFAQLRPNVALDLRHIAEEIADLGHERRAALRSWTRRIIEHLLLLQYSPAKEPRDGWIDEVETFRDDIEERLTPSLRRDLQRQLPRLYGRARERAGGKLERYGETGAAARALPLRPGRDSRRLLAAAPRRRSRLTHGSAMDEENCRQRRSVHDHRGGRSRSSSPMISSGVWPS
jgi:hypothetical protein